MPLFAYRCPEGHETELLRPRDVELVSCPCGQPAKRIEVYRVGFSGFARTPVDQRQIKMRNFNEANAEIGHRESRQTNIDGSPARTPSHWRAAKAEASRLSTLGVKDSGDL